MTRLSAHGLAIDIPAGFECRITRRSPVGGEETNTVVHLANFTLPEQRDDFGGGVTETMRAFDVLVVLFEYSRDSSRSALFASAGVPTVRISQFSPRRLQRPLPGQVGCQLFFSANGRAFCLYIVAGSRAVLPALVGDINATLSAIEIGP